MKEQTIDIWKKKLNWIVQKGGMALINVHSDYMNFSKRKNAAEEYPTEYYNTFLEYIKSEYEGQYWHALPKEMASFWINNMVAME
jgi:hypothetical protein